MKASNYVIYGSIIFLVILSIYLFYVKLNEHFASKEYTKKLKGTENGTASLKCGKDEIITNVVLTKWGTSIYMKDVKSILARGISNINLNKKTKCIGKNSCSFKVDNKLVGKDPAPGAKKYWTLSYKCVPDPDVIAAKQKAEAAAADAKQKDDSDAAAKQKADAEVAAQQTAEADTAAKQKAEAEVAAQQMMAAAEMSAAKQKAEEESARIARVKAEADAADAKQKAQQVAFSEPQTVPETIQPTIVITPLARLLPFMAEDRLLVPFTQDEIIQYKNFHITVLSCAIKEALNKKAANKQTSFKDYFAQTLESMGLISHMFLRNLDAYMYAIQKQSDRTWKEVFESVLFLNPLTENIQYFINNPSQSRLNQMNQPNGSIQYVRKPILNEDVFISSYEKCKTRINSLEFYSPVSFSVRLND